MDALRESVSLEARCTLFHKGLDGFFVVAGTGTGHNALRFTRKAGVQVFSQGPIQISFIMCAKATVGPWAN